MPRERKCGSASASSSVWTGETQQSAAFVSVTKNCGGHAFQFSFTPESVAERDLYGDAPVAVLITE